MKKILLVEDEAALQKNIGGVLREEGYEIISAMDGETGFKLAKKEQPNLILLDLILPKMNGFEVLESLKADEKTKEIPVVVLTNLERMEDLDRALELGAKTYLVKTNYTLTEVKEKIKKMLE
jgi:CheY-like chemotaxis protein